MLGDPLMECFLDLDKYFEMPYIWGMPDNIMLRIFEMLDTPSQICLALTRKSLARGSRLLHNYRGITYSRGDQLRLFGRLGPWMTMAYGYCNKCNKFVARNSQRESRKQPWHYTANARMYGSRFDHDLSWEDGECPRCRATRQGKSFHNTRVALMDALWGPNLDVYDLTAREYGGGYEGIDPEPLHYQGQEDQSE